MLSISTNMDLANVEHNNRMTDTVNAVLKGLNEKVNGSSEMHKS